MARRTRWGGCLVAASLIFSLNLTLVQAQHTVLSIGGPHVSPSIVRPHVRTHSALPAQVPAALQRAINASRPKVTWMQQATLSDPNAAAYDEFGIAVALSADGNTALVGPFGAANNAGAAYVFVRNGTSWTQQATLTSPNGTPNDYFGAAVALSSDGNTALVGAPNHAGSAGSAYVFTRYAGTWSQFADLNASDGAANDHFGGAVALSGDGSTALVGASGHDQIKGAAYVFVRQGDGWPQQAELADPAGGAGDSFGAAVAVGNDGNIALIGAFDTGAQLGETGFVFARNAAVWTKQAALPTASSNRFGIAVALSGDDGTALVGVPALDEATVFVHSSTWALQAMLIPVGGTPGDQFGSTVALSGDGSTALIGAYGTNSYTGAAALFARTGSTWIQQTTLSDPTGIQGDQFGDAVALSADGGTALVGADGVATFMGAAYIFSNGIVATPTATPAAATSTPAPPTATGTSTVTSTPTSTPSPVCRLSMVPAQRQVEQGGTQSLLFASTPGAVVTASILTRSTYPSRAVVIGQNVAVVRGIPIPHGYQFTFQASSRGRVTLTFVIPRHAPLGTVFAHASTAPTCAANALFQVVAPRIHGGHSSTTNSRTPRTRKAMVS